MNETLVIRLMSRCDCDCVFCCVREEIASAHDFPFDKLRAKVLEHPRHAPIDLFGGEPTLYPYFLDALSFIRERGHPVSIATNGHRFADPEFTNQVATMGVSQIRTSLYGHTAELHDYHTRRKNSFKLTTQGMANILDAGIELYVNTVITQENVLHLPEIVQFLHRQDVQNIKFGSLVNVDHCHEIVPSMELVRQSLTRALEISDKLGQRFAVEKSPFCLVPQYRHAFVSEQDDYLFRKPTKCQNCGLIDMCVGIPKDHLSLYGDDFVIPFPRLEPSTEELQVEESKNIFASWNDEISSAITIIVKTAGMCNLACDYCYASRNLNQHEQISEELVDALNQRLSDSHFGRIDFNWHGGEPLICGQEIYEYAFSKQKEILGNPASRVLMNRLQTNGVLINEEWCDFFHDHNIEVSLSLDGPEIIHDLHRFNHRQQGSFNQVMKGMDRLSEKEVGFGILCVITADTVPFVTDIYNFFRNIVTTRPGMIRSIDFLPCYKIDEARMAPSQLTLEHGRYADFMIPLFDYWFSDDDTSFSIPFFEETMTVFLGGKAQLCTHRRGCKSFVTIQPNGDAYPCDFFEGIPEFRLGNIHTHTFADLFQSEAYQRYLSEVVAHPVACVQCEWFRVCQGGCAYESFYSKGRNHFCSDLVRIYNHIDSTVSSMYCGYTRYKGVE